MSLETLAIGQYFWNVFSLSSGCDCDCPWGICYSQWWSSSPLSSDSTALETSRGMTSDESRGTLCIHLDSLMLQLKVPDNNHIDWLTWLTDWHLIFQKLSGFIVWLVILRWGEIFVCQLRWSRVVVVPSWCRAAKVRSGSHLSNMWSEVPMELVLEWI